MFCTFKYLYDSYVEAVGGENPLHYWSFLKMIRKKFDGKIKQPRRTRLGRCSVCCDFDTAAALLKGDKEKRAELKEAKKRHIEFQLKERKAYKDRREEAKKNPSE